MSLNLVTHADIGAKVVRNPDNWPYAGQDKGAEYGIISNFYRDDWYKVTWYNKEGIAIESSHHYKLCNLCYYESSFEYSIF